MDGAACHRWLVTLGLACCEFFLDAGRRFLPANTTGTHVEIDIVRNIGSQGYFYQHVCDRSVIDEGAG